MKMLGKGSHCQACIFYLFTVTVSLWEKSTSIVEISKVYLCSIYIFTSLYNVQFMEWKLVQDFTVCTVTVRDVNVHKTNSFFRLNFQFVSISKLNVLFYSCIAVIESQLKAISFTKSEKKTKAKWNETYFWVNSKKQNVFDTKKAKRWHSKPKTCFWALKNPSIWMVKSKR
jgi:hypothetical protein